MAVTRAYIRVFAVLAIVCALVVSSGCTVLASDSPQPVVAIDLFHYNVLSLRPQSTWRMTALRNELVSGGYAIREIDRPITEEILAGCSVLVITTPNIYYSAGEMAAIRGLVTGGGGVFFGANYGLQNGSPTPWASICQNFANAFGLTLDNNSATDALHNASGYPYWVSFDSSCIGSHPVANGVNSLQCYATTTIAPSAGATAVASTDSDAVPPLRPAVVATPYQDGRVVLAGSSLYLADPVMNLNLGTMTADMLGITAADNRRFAYNAITWLAGTAGRPLVSVTTTPPAVVYDRLELAGTVCDAGLVSYVLEYAPASDTSQWIQVGPTHNASVVNGTLGAWDVAEVNRGDYILRVRATNSTGNEYSVSLPVLVEHPVVLSKASDAVGVPDGTLVSIAGKCVVAGSDDLNGRVYLEEDDRSSGIAVIANEDAPRGSRISVVGTLGVDLGVRAISALSVSVDSPQGLMPAPLAVVNRCAGPTTTGLGTPGILVKAFGKVISSDASGFTIDDGSFPGGLVVLTGYSRETVPAPEPGQMVSVVGIGASTGDIPAIVTRLSTDVQNIE